MQGSNKWENHNPTFIAIGFLTFPHNYKLGIGIFSFYCGAATFFFSKLITSRLHLLPRIMLSTSLLCISWIIIIDQSKNNAFIITGLGFTSFILFLTTIDGFEKCHIFSKSELGRRHKLFIIPDTFPTPNNLCTRNSKIGFSRDIFIMTVFLLHLCCPY